MNADQIVTIDDPTELTWLAAAIERAAVQGHRIRFAVDGGGLKIAAGAGMWTLPLGRIQA